MAHFFREADRRQRFLLPVDMMDWLPEDGPSGNAGGGTSST
jgi:hypothetical protein